MDRGSSPENRNAVSGQAAAGGQTATTVTLSQGVPLETVSKMLGHKHITTTQIYAKITNDKIGRDMDALSQKIAEKFPIA